MSFANVAVFTTVTYYELSILTSLPRSSNSCHYQDVVKVLLQRGAGVNSKDKDNITALMEASIMDHRDVVKHLLKV